jgi:hypothetical protein
LDICGMPNSRMHSCTDVLQWRRIGNISQKDSENTE